MSLIELEQKELTELSRTYGKVYKTEIGEVSYTKLVNPEGFVLIAKDDQLRFYLFRELIQDVDKDGKVTESFAPWEHVWGASSIVHDGLPTSEELIKWRLNHALSAGKQGLDVADALSEAALDKAASTGTSVHKAAEDLLNGKEVTIVGRSKKEMWGIGSLANFLSDHEVRNWQTERIVAYAKWQGCSHEGGEELHRRTSKCKHGDGIRYVYGGTTDIVIEIKDKKTGKWENWLIDYKTSADVYLSHKIQGIGYKEAYEQSYGIKIDRLGILLLGKQTEKGYLLAEVGKERNHKLTFEDFKLTYRMLVLVNNGKLPAPSYKTFPRSIKLSKEDKSENNDNSSSGTSSGGPDNLPRSEESTSPERSSGGGDSSSAGTETRRDEAQDKQADDSNGVKATTHTDGKADASIGNPEEQSSGTVSN